MQPGQTFPHTIAAAGVYRYHCTIHSWMTGSVTVLGSASTTSSSNSTSAGGIPEFPFAGLAAAVLSALVVASYLVVRKSRRG